MSPEWERLGSSFQSGDPAALDRLASPLLWWFCQAFSELQVDARLRPMKAAEALQRAWDRRASFDPFDEEDRWAVAREVAGDVNGRWIVISRHDVGEGF